MTIAALPLETVRSLGSTQALTDSASLVKELVDNALDARASAVGVEIAVNTLDVIQVKDNGHGIAPDDRSLVCRRYCTSKVRDLHDVANIGGVSLGFRGEALASAAEMSGALVLSTRVEGEAVATSMRMDRQSKIVSQERVSHPVGTTVRVTDFLKHLPIRKQTALKVSAKMNTKIKRVLQAYALARPCVRFSLKVLKAKDEKGNWTYAPKAGSTVEDAALKVLNTQAVGQCRWQVWTKQTTENCENAEGDDPETASYRIEALLPKPQCDNKLVSHVGQYISIDSRPVSCARGSLKRVVTLFKTYLRSANPAENEGSIVDPVLCMNITCPPGSYDANVEPAKDDVLFSDPDSFLRIVECFFEEMYGKLSTAFSERIRPEEQRPKQQGFDLLLRPPRQLPRDTITETLAVPDNVDGESLEAPLPGERLQPKCYAHQTRKSSSDSPEISRLGQEGPASSLLRSTNDNDSIIDERHTKVPRSREESIWRPNMYNVDFDDEEYDCVTQEPMHVLTGNIEEEEDALRDVRVSNPWTIAKVNAPIRRVQPDRSTTGIACLNGQLLTPARQRGDTEQNDDTPSHDSRIATRGDAAFLPTPHRSQVRESSPEHSPDRLTFPPRAWGSGNRDVRINPQDESTMTRPGERALDDWVQRSRPDFDDFVSARSLPAGTPLNAIPEILEKQRKQPRKRQPQQTGANQPFKSPVNDPHRVWFDPGSPRRHNGPRKLRPQTNVDNAAATAQIRDASEDEEYASAENQRRPTLASTMHPDLAVTMDYEARKQAAMQKRREALLQNPAIVEVDANGDQARNSPSIRTSPYKNRYNKAVAALNPDKTTAGIAVPVFQDGDPRAYLMRLQQSEDAERHGGLAVSRGKLKRRKTTLLPLETVPANETVHDLILTVDTSQQVVHDHMADLADSDDYIRCGKITRGFSCITEEVSAWEAQLRSLLVENFQAESGGMPNIELDLGAILQNHETDTNK